MKLVTPQLEIDANNPFDVSDKLGRKDFAESLSNLIISTDDSLVIALDAPWGEGKTTFVKMWQIFLEKEKGLNSIYFDAFANDFMDEPFVAISSEIAQLAEKLSTDNHLIGSKLSRFKEKVSVVAPKLLSTVAKIGVKAVTLKVVSDTDIEALDDIKNDLSKDGSELISDYVLKKLESYQKDKDTINAFGKILEELADAISGDESNKIVFIIDELDRCKPTYAIEVIEKIKHIFSVKNVAFVLVMNKEQLELSVKSIYGEIDANTYLQKFITLNCNLPKYHGEYRPSDYKKYCKHLYDVHEMELEQRGIDAGALVTYTASLGLHYGLSLRQLEKVFTYYALFYSLTTGKPYSPAGIFSFLVVTRVINSDLYILLSRQSADLESIIKEEKLDCDYSTHRELLYIEKINLWLRFCLLSDEEYNALEEGSDVKRFDGSLWNYGLDREKIVPYICSIIDMYKFT